MNQPGTAVMLTWSMVRESWFETEHLLRKAEAKQNTAYSQARYAGKVTACYSLLSCRKENQS